MIACPFCNHECGRGDDCTNPDCHAKAVRGVTWKPDVMPDMTKDHRHVPMIQQAYSVEQKIKAISDQIVEFIRHLGAAAAVRPPAIPLIYPAGARTVRHDGRAPPRAPLRAPAFLPL